MTRLSIEKGVLFSRRSARLLHSILSQHLQNVRSCLFLYNHRRVDSLLVTFLLTRPFIRCCHQRKIWRLHEVLKDFTLVNFQFAQVTIRFIVLKSYLILGFICFKGCQGLELLVDCVHVVVSGFLLCPLIIDFG